MRTTAVTALAAIIMVATACAATLPPAARGGKTVYIQAEEGPLQIEVSKRDLNIYEGPDELLVDIFSPRRSLVEHLEIPDDGQEAPGAAEEYQRVATTIDVDLPGVYRVQISGSGDTVWGIETSAERYVVEGAITFSHGEMGGSIYFPPPSDAFTITGRAMHEPGIQTVPLRDARGQLIAEMKLNSTQEDTVLEFEAEQREGLWELEIAHLDVTFEIAGVDRWTADEGAWFETGKNRWMLMPYNTARYLKPGEETIIDFTLRNSTGAADSFTVAASADAGATAQVIEPPMPIELEPNETATVRVAFTAWDDVPQGRTIATQVVARAESEPTAISYSGVEIRIGESPVGDSLEMPIVLRPFEHEDYQFGYAPDYMTNEVHFGPGNFPFIRQRTSSVYGSTGIFTLVDGQWIERRFIETLREAYPDLRSMYGAGGFRGAKIGFDGQDGLYTTLDVRTEQDRFNVLLFSPDRGETWQVHELIGTAADLEQFTGHNAHDGPPPILVYDTVAPHPARFAAYNDVYIYIPRREGNTLELGDPVKVAENCVGMCQHSGGPASMVTIGDRTHIVWGEIAPDDAPGVPTYVATYDHTTGEVGEKVLLGYGPPVNDVHNVPAITADSEGTLHVLIGAHGAPFHYVRSLAPNDAYGGWTEAEPILKTGYMTDEGEAGRQTYISLVCDANDTLHTAFRQWRRGVDQYHPGSHYAALSVQHRPKGGEWSDAEPLVIAARPGYSIWYHKLTVDRLGDLFLSYSYWTQDAYQEQFPDRYHHRAVLVSRDGGRRWKLAETVDFIRGVQLYAESQGD